MSFDIDRVLGREKIPTQYNGLSFLQWDSYDEDKYKKLTEHEKRQMSYWVETQAIRRGANMGLGIGVVLGVIGAFIWLAIFG